MEMGLEGLCPGDAGIVTKLNTPPKTTARLRSFGLVPGTEVRCSYRSPGGKVTALEFVETVIAMRTKDLSMIRVKC